MAAVAFFIARSNKREDWRRQDEVAKRAATVAVKLQENGVKINDKLDIIHTLVNSNVTKEMEARLEGARRELVGLKEIIDLKRAAGSEPNKDTLASLISTEEGIHLLETDLQDRRRQQALVNQQVEADKK